MRQTWGSRLGDLVWAVSFTVTGALFGAFIGAFAGTMRGALEGALGGAVVGSSFIAFVAAADRIAALVRARSGDSPAPRSEANPRSPDGSSIEDWDRRRNEG